MLADVVVAGLAGFRLWRLIAEDTILDGPRLRVWTRLPGKVQELAGCPWCLGFWLSAGVFAVLHGSVDVELVAGVFAAGAVAGTVAVVTE